MKTRNFNFHLVKFLDKKNQDKCASSHVSYFDILITNSINYKKPSLRSEGKASHIKIYKFMIIITIFLFCFVLFFVFLGFLLYLQGKCFKEFFFSWR